MIMALRRRRWRPVISSVIPVMMTENLSRGGPVDQEERDEERDKEDGRHHGARQERVGGGRDRVCFPFGKRG